MRYLSENDVTQMMGSGYLGEVRQGPDGNLYQYVQGVDGLGNPIGGFWRRFKRLARRVVRKALPYVQQFAPLIPGIGPALSVLTSAIPAASGMAPMMAPAEMPAAMPAAPAAEAAPPPETSTAGLGLGAIAMGQDGHLYQWVQGVDGLGNPIGFWKRLRRFARRALPIAQQLAPFIPGGAAALTAAAPILQQAGVAGHAGLGALYQAPDGTLYQQVQGLAEDEELRGLDEDEELRGLDEDEELRGLSEEEDLRGLDEDEELRGLAEDEELRGFEADQEMEGIDGYVRQDGMPGLDAYVPPEPPQTRWHTAPAQSPEIWKPLW
ncbi:MAG: hypothetical protein ACREWG_11560 [Gammaproteobacteria bacterium]